ncbi:MAG: class I SAM-dependent methyltransferase, partial [Omnitrophica bacterium]|nr:class I SAM-dependent methyltransferase [Candidatus Omnitrophota bacterium]
KKEDILASDQEPLSQIVSNFAENIESLKVKKNLSEELRPLGARQNRVACDDTSSYDHFGSLFSKYVNKKFWKQPYHQLMVRLKRNNVDLSIFKNAMILDMGCGSGRNVFVLKELGADKVIGIDISESGVVVAKSRQKELGMDGLEFYIASALKLPFDDNAFDIVFSVGVFHHTPDWKKCLYEMYRVMKPGGIGLLMYLNEKPGGLFWDVIEILRCVVRDDPPLLIQRSLEILGINPNHIIKQLDPLLCHINVRLSVNEIESHLNSLGAYEIRRFLRGADTDRIEKVYNKEPFAKEKYGIGGHRYFFHKPL